MFNIERQEKFDPKTLNDPVALLTNWDPVKSGGSQICTHMLKETPQNRMAFKMCLKPTIGAMILIGIGLIITIGLTLPAIQDGRNIAFFSTPLGLVFLSAGIFMFYHWSKSRIFDLQKGYYYKRQYICPIKDIYALQIIETSSGALSMNDHSSTRYEMNIVQPNGKRLNVITHGQLYNIRLDAQKLSIFLNIPLWNAL